MNNSKTETTRFLGKKFTTFVVMVLVFLTVAGTVTPFAVYDMSITPTQQGGTITSVSFNDEDVAVDADGSFTIGGSPLGKHANRDNVTITQTTFPTSQEAQTDQISPTLPFADAIGTTTTIIFNGEPTTIILGEDGQFRIVVEDYLLSATNRSRVRDGFGFDIIQPLSSEVLSRLTFPRYIELDGGRLPINHPNIVNIIPAGVEYVSDEGNRVPVARVSASSPSAVDVPSGNGLPAGIIVTIDSDTAIWTNTLTMTNAGRSTNVSAFRYLFIVDDVSYEIFCADPTLPGPENPAAIYAQLGNINHAGIRNALRYGSPHNPYWDAPTQADRVWYTYVTRVAVAMAANPSATFNGDPTIISAAQVLVAGANTGQNFDETMPAIAVNGVRNREDLNRVVSPGATTAKSETFTTSSNRRKSLQHNSFYFEWAAGTPAGARLVFNGNTYIAPNAPTQRIVVNAGSPSVSFTLEMPNEPQFLGQTARVYMVGEHNEFAGEVRRLQHPTNPQNWQDMVFYVPYMRASAAFSFATDDIPFEYGAFTPIKVNIYTGQEGGGTFTVTGSNGFSQTVNGGTPITNRPVGGTYTVTYTGTGETRSVTIQPNRTTPVTVQFNNGNGGGYNGVTIQKICAITGVIVPGAVIRLRGIDNPSIDVTQVLTAGATVAMPDGITSTVINGVWRIDGLPPGHYEVIEVQAPNGFSMQPGPTQQTFLKEAGSDAHIMLTFANFPFSEVEIIKREMSNGVGNNQPLAGAEFRIQGFYPGTPPRVLDRTATTDAQGRIVFSDLPAGQFTITEIAPPTGYTFGDIRTWSVTVNWGDSVSAGTANSITAFNIPKSSLEVLKVCGVTNRPLAGAVFSLTDPTTGESWQAASNAQGIAVFGIGNYGNFLYPNRVYSLREIIAPQGFVLMGEPREIVLSPGVENRVTIQNWENPGLTIIKQCQDTQERLAGAEFTIVAQGSGRPLPVDFPLITDANGEIHIPWTLFAGESERVFLVTEVVPPLGFHLADPNWQIVTMQAGHNHTLVFQNRRMPALTIQKHDAVTGDAIQNAEFTVERLSSAASPPAPIGMITGNPFRTDAQGRITLPHLGAGVYRIIETRAANGYWLDTDVSNRTWTITLRENEDYVLQAENILLPTLIIEKWNALTYRPIPMTQFRIDFEVPFGGGGSGSSVSGGGNLQHIGYFMTDANGQIVLPFVQPGWFVITETRPAPGMQMPSNPVTRVFLAPGRHTYNVLLQVPNLTLGQTGQITLPTPPPVAGFTPEQWAGMTEVERQAHLRGSLTVTSGNDHLATSGGGSGGGTGGSGGSVGTIWNWPANSIVIQKRCSVTNQLLQGAEFEVIHTSAGVSGTLGTVIGRYITDNSGIIVLTGLVAGSFVVREVNPPTGFTLGANNSQTVFLAPDGHSVVEVVFNNDPFGSLLLAKSCSVTGRPLAGAVFRVTDSTGAVVGTSNGLFTTGANGEVLIPNLPPATYLVTEVTAPNGFVLDSTPQTIRVNATGNTYRVEFTNTPLSSVIIRKLSQETNQPLAGARFTVRQQSGGAGGATGGGGNLIGEFVTDSSGTIEIPNVLGWLVIEEVTPPPGYTLADNNVRTVEVRPGSPTVVEFRNPRLSNTTIRKISGDDGRALAGVVFEVSHFDGGRVRNPIDNSFEFVTNSAGMIHLPRLELGVYVARETRALPGYQLAEPYIFTVEANRDTTIIIRNYRLPRLPNVTIRKISGDDGRALAGVVFEIDRADGSRVRNDIPNSPQRGSYEFVTNNTGQIITPNMEAGRYVLRETRALAGYRLADSVNFTVTEGGEDITLIVRNYKQPSVVIRKIDGDTGQPLQGVQFEIRRFLANGQTGQAIKNYAVDNSYTFTTNQAGHIYLPTLEDGMWVAIETRALPGFMLAEPHIFRVGDNGDMTIVIRNYRYPSLTIQKINSVTRAPLAGVHFEINRPDGTRIINPQTGFHTFITNHLGLIHLPAMPDGQYFLRETRALPGFIIDEEIILFYVNAEARRRAAQGQVGAGANPTNHLLVVENTPASGLMIIKTCANTGNPLQGVEFEIRHADGRLVRGLMADQNQPNTYANSPNLAPNGNFVTDHRGMIHLPHLEYGVLHITEIRALPSFVLDTTTHVVTLTPGRLTTLEVANQQMAGLRIYKIDSVTSIGIPGVEFRLFDFITNREAAGPFITDSNGVIDLMGILPEGRFLLRETQAAPGYILDTMPRTIELRSGMVTTVTWENTREAGQIQITKLSSADNQINGLPAGSRLEGAVFEVRDWRTGNVLDQFITDHRGVGVSRPLPLGRMLIEEIVSPAFYKRSDVILDITIEHSGQIIRMDFFNEPANVGVEVRKVGPVEVMSGQPIVWNITTIANSSNIPLSDFYVRDILPAHAVRLDMIFSGTFNQSLRYSIMFRTNLNDQWRVAYDNLSSTTNNALVMSPTALGLRSNEFVTEIMYSFGAVRAGFRSVEAPRLEGTVRDGLQNGYEFANRIDIGGRSGSEWVIGNNVWVTRVWRPTQGQHPRTGW